MGVPYGYYSIYESKDKLSELITKRVQKVMEDLVDSNGSKNGLINTDNYSDLNKNNIPDISEIEDMIPWEFDVMLSLLSGYLEQQEMLRKQSMNESR